MARTGRPKKEIDETQFTKLCGLQCTEEEIAGFFDCSVDTIERWCKRELKETFAEAFKKRSVGGKVSLRRYQFELAKKSAAMAIWLGKQYLGQTDHIEMDASIIQDSTREQVGLLIDELSRVDTGEGDTDISPDTV